MPRTTRSASGRPRSSRPRPPDAGRDDGRDAVFGARALAELLRTFDLDEGTLSPEPVAYGRVGEIWRLDCADRSWAVKAERNAMSEEGLAPSVRFHEAAVAAGLPAPVVRRTRDRRVVGRVGGRDVRVLSWVDMAPADPSLDPSVVGRLLAGLHHLPRMPGDDGAV